MRRAAAGLLGLGFAILAAAADAPPAAVYVAELSSIHLVPKDPSDGPVRKSGSITQVTIDNGGGYFEARFSVLRTITGPVERQLDVTGSIGERGRLPFEVSLHPLALWLKRNGRKWELVHALPAYEEGPSGYGIVPFNRMPCVDITSKAAWTPADVPIFLGLATTLTAEYVDSLRQVDAISQEEGAIYAQKVILLTKALAGPCVP